jgi:hypothetical protein
MTMPNVPTLIGFVFVDCKECVPNSTILRASRARLRCGTA